jgi:hypothetical protein
VCLTRLKNYKIKTQQKIDPQQQNQTQNIKKIYLQELKNRSTTTKSKQQKKKKNQTRVEALNDVERGE